MAPDYRRNVLGMETASRGGQAAVGTCVLLAVLLASGLWLRAWGLNYGLPLPSARPDEEVLISKLLGFDAGDPNPHWFIYPSLSLYLAYAWVKAILLLTCVLGLGPGTADLATVFRQDPSALYLAARSLSAALGTATIWVVYAVGRAGSGRAAGLVAALLTAFSFLHVRESHFFKPDAMLSFFTTLALLGCLRLQQRGTRGAAVAAGLACGLAIAVKYGVLLLVPLGLAVLLGPPAGAGRPARATRGAIALAAMGAGFALTSPFAVLAPQELIAALKVVRMWVAYAGDGLGGGFRHHLLYSFFAAQGLPLTVAVIGALAWSLMQRPLLPVAGFVAVSFLQLGLSAAAYSRYLTPVLPAAYALVGAGVVRGLASVPARMRPVVATLLLATLAVRPLHSAIRFDQIVAVPDTRLLAAAWMEARVPRGTPVLIVGSRWPYVFGEPPLDAFRLRRNLPLDPRFGVRWVVTHEHPIPFSTVPPEFEALRPSLHLVATISPFAGDTVPPGALFEHRDAFYVPIAGFTDVVRGGPLIRIYSLSAEDEDGAT